jgi:SAM-dependent methyltransferase
MKANTAEVFMGKTPNKDGLLDDRHRKVIKIFGKYKFDKILDVGCGDGNFSIMVKEACQASKVYGIEATEKGVELAQENGVVASRLDIDSDVFPFEEGSFDAVFAGEIIEHLFDPDHFLDEIYRVLRPGGILVLTTPNLASIHNRIALIFGYQPFPMGISSRFNEGRMYEPESEQAQSLDHIRVLTLRSLKKLMNIHNIQIIEITGSCASLPKTMRFRRTFELLDRAFTISPGLSYRVIVEGKKV